jgi:hypothetical protein
MGETDPINTCSVQNAVAIADIVGSGWHMFETCGGPMQETGVGKLFDYPLPTSPGVEPPWPMWRDNPSHDGVATSTMPNALSPADGKSKTKKTSRSS